MDPAAEPATGGFTDIPRQHWIERLPAWMRPYARLARIDRPVGAELLLYPCWWGAALAAARDGRLPDWWHILLFAVGAFVMRAAGCVLNDWADRDFDRQVERTRARPLASGALSVRQAFVFLSLLLLFGLAILLQFNGATIAAGVASLPLVVVYPFMKRITWWPQAFLGLVFSWGALVGWTSWTGALELPALLLYAGGIAWVLGYDTIYAHQDKEDDALVGVRSSALRLGAGTRPWLFGFYGSAVLLWGAAGAAAGAGPLLYAGLAAAATQLAVQAWRVDIDDPRSCLRAFRSNRWTGWIVFAAAIAGSWRAAA
ncbi:MAG: 4-hydroxybenzoate octaprenyltransferase [Alphaproteobacteria bacterium]|nr:4-hydroxybenzoate octaprenyltransferase [Alphaproteobacteria bacterium]